MKRSTLIIILSLSAILIVAGIETILVNRIFRLQVEKFDYRYREIVQKGLSVIDKPGRNPGFANAYFLLDFQVQKAMPFYYADSPDTVSFKEVVLRQFHLILNGKQDIDSLLARYLQKVRAESDFHSRMAITNLVLLSDGEEVDVFDAQRDTSWLYPDTIGLKSKLLPVNHYQYFGDRFAIGFDYYVDFDNKKQVVVRELAGSLVIALLALAAVCFVFIITMKNLMEEKRLSQLKTDFINNMTHELKTPLSTISVATRTLENDSVLDDRGKIRETVSVIRRQNRQLTRQINHLLEISMWERKQFSLDRKMVELEPFFKGIAESFRWECAEKKCQLYETIELARSVAFIDETQMTVALHNLLINGVKYNTGDPEITLDVKCTDRLRISVADNGIGISREDQKHIFDKFYRVSTGNVHKVKGLGLGLFYVRQIAEAHGGTVEVTSKPGKGSIFTINIPANGKDQNSAGRG